MAVETRLMTAEEFWARANEFSGCELVNGVVVPKHPEWRRGAMSPTSRQHGRIEVKLGTRISIFLQAHDLGEAYSGEVGFILSKDPDVVRAPDLAFVSHDRLKGVGEDGYLPLAPDLAIEIVSPGDTSREVQPKEASVNNLDTFVTCACAVESCSCTSAICDAVVVRSVAFVRV